MESFRTYFNVQQFFISVQSITLESVNENWCNSGHEIKNVLNSFISNLRQNEIVTVLFLR